jgi:hypothetical protein
LSSSIAKRIEEAAAELEGDDLDDSWHSDSVWTPPDSINEEQIIESRAQLSPLKKSARGSVRPSQFAGFAFRFPTEDEDSLGENDSGFDRFSFEGRRHMKRLYDTPAKRILLFCGRQVEKSTLLGNRALCYMSLVPSFRVLYVSPSATQARKFSADRIKEPIDTSPVLRRFTTRMLSSNILEKQFVNRSQITMRYAFLNADRTRGIPAHMLCIDEFQDVIGDNIPVIEQCLSHAPERWKMYMYAGTPKSLDNNLETYWSRFSTQNEWVVPHDCKGGEGGRYWNDGLCEKNIGKRGLICANCGTLINPMKEGAQWACTGDPEAQYEGYRIPQLMVPWVDWKNDIVLNYERYSRDKFYNEVLGLSYDSGLRPLTSAQVRAVCNNDLSMGDIESYRQLGYNQSIYCGIDWGTGENSFTVLVLATYVDGKFRIFFAHRFEGEETDPDIQMTRIKELIKFFNVKFIGADYGGGYHSNHNLVRAFGANRVWSFQHLGKTNRKVVYDSNMGRFKVSRSEVMGDFFNAIKRGQCEFPKWEEWQEPFGQDMLNIFSEWSDNLRMLQYKHKVDKPDDTFHAFMYAWLVSMLEHPRLDIIVPTREENGVPVPQYTGPLDQGSY